MTSAGNIPDPYGRPGTGAPQSPGYQPPPRATSIDAGKLWASGLATALVAALAAMVGMLIATVTLDLNPVAPDWVLGNSSDATLTTRFALTGFLAALLATALLHLLLISTPRPLAFFGWIVALATIAIGVTPFAIGGNLDDQLATALTVLVVGAVIGSLLSAAATVAVRRAVVTDPNAPPTW